MSEADAGAVAAAAEPLSRRLSYAQCWEDFGILREALDVGPEDDVLSVSSAGDNSFALALQGARSVTLIDLSEPQLAVAELKLRGGHLPYADFLTLLGLSPDGAEGSWDSTSALAIYRTLRSRLTDRARGFFDERSDLLEQGLVRSGRFEGYLDTFRRKVLPLVHTKATIRGLLALENLEDQQAYYDDKWNTWRWRGLFRLFFSRFVMAKLGRSEEHFAQVEGNVADRLLDRAGHALTQIPIRSNPFMQWILSGDFTDLEQAHPYLSKEGHARLREIEERVQFVHAPLEAWLDQAGPNAFSAYNLSNIFEYMPADAHAAILERVAGVSRPGARIAYWNLFVDRQAPDALQARLERDKESGDALLQRDRAFFYQAFRVEVVR